MPRRLAQTLGTMNKDQTRNVREVFDKVFEAIFRCWSYVHLIRGLQAGAKANKERLEENALAVDLIYRGVFEAIFAASGTIVDNRKGTYSIPSVITMVRKYTSEDHPIRAELKKAEEVLNSEDNSPLIRMRNWRHKVVAHHTKEGRTEKFYPENKLYLGEVEELLQEIEDLANQITVPLLKQGTECKTGSEKDVKRQAENLLNP